ncbi:MAG: hypothetical protein ACOYL3_15605 [Desulfuromonadaceae bacterium]
MIRLYGTAYLDLQNNREYINTVKRNLTIYGVNNPVSRLCDFQHSEYYAEAENLIAHEFVTEDACLFPNGYLAGMATKRVLTDIARIKKGTIITPETAHPCYSVDGRHLKTDHKVGIKLNYHKKIIIMSAINSFYGEIDESYHLLNLKNIHVAALDVSHTAFIWDHNLISPYTNLIDNIIFFGSLSKAASYPAGFVAGPKDIIKKLREQPEFSTSCPPSIAHTVSFISSENIRRKQLEKLNKVAEKFNNGMQLSRPINSGYLPIYNINSDNEKIYKLLLNNGFEASFMSYPFKESMKHLRVVLNAGLNVTLINKIIDLLIDHQTDVSCFTRVKLFDVVFEQPHTETVISSTISTFE